MLSAVLYLTLTAIFSIPLSGFATQTFKWWDINGTTAGCGGTSPSGTWGTAAANWATGSGNGTTATAVWNNTSPELLDARFSAGTDGTGAFTVTVGGTSLAQFGVEEGSPTFVGSGGTGSLTFVGTNETIQILTGINADRKSTR